MLSVTAQYALRALAYVADAGDDRPVLAREIAEHTGVPLQYLSRILRDAVRAGLLDSARGVGGGFRLARPAKKITLLAALAPFDDVVGRAKCPFGQSVCSDTRPCGFHNHWKPVATAYRQMLESTTLADVSVVGLVGTRKRA